MRVAANTFEFDDETRRLINRRYGLPGLATRKTCREFVDLAVSGALEDLDADPAPRAIRDDDA